MMNTNTSYSGGGSLRLLTDFRLLLMLFIAFRFMLLIAYQPFLIEGQERGVGTGGDRAYHFALASLADQDLYPFRDWWSEFPPLWYLTTTLVYVLLGEGATYDTWSLILGVLMIVSETGCLLMVRKIGGRLHGEQTGMALAWIYAVMLAPIVFMWWNFDSLVTFFMLLSLWLLLIGQDTRSAWIAALGGLTKFVPLLILGAVLRWRDARQAGRYVLMALGVFVLAYVPLMALNSEMTLISLTAQFNKPSYQTVWALLDGNYTTGNFGTIESHLSVAGVTDGVSDKNPAVIPGWLRLGVAAILGLVVFIRTRRMDDVGLVAFVGITLLIFYLQSQGFSPQWLTQIIPLVILVFPTRQGVLLALILSLLAFIEYPFLFIRTGDTGGVMVPSNPFFGVWTLIVVLRTVILLGISWMYYEKLRQNPILETM